MSTIKSLHARHNSDRWTMSYNPNYGCAILIHDVDTNGEYVTAQFSIEETEGTVSTPIRTYKLYSTAPDTHGDVRYYFRMYGWRLYTDGFMWRGGNISECQKIMVEKGYV